MVRHHHLPNRVTPALVTPLHLWQLVISSWPGLGTQARDIACELAVSNRKLLPTDAVVEPWRENPALSGVAGICCEEGQRWKLCRGALTVNFRAGCSRLLVD